MMMVTLSASSPLLSHARLRIQPHHHHHHRRGGRCSRTTTTTTTTTRTTRRAATTGTDATSSRDDDDDDDDEARARRWEDSFLSSSSSSSSSGGGLAPTVTYSSPVEYTYGEGEVTPITTPSTVMYQQQLSSDTFVDVFKASRAKRRELSGYESKTVRFFRPEPNTVLVRWRAEWSGRGGGVGGVGGGREGGTAVEGQTKYRLRESESRQVVSSVEETWEFSSQGSERVRFLQALGFCAAHAPPGAALPDVLPAVKLAAWQALKDDPNYGGNLIREELDVITVNAVIAFSALCFSTSLLFIEILTILVHRSGA